MPALGACACSQTNKISSRAKSFTDCTSVYLSTIEISFIIGHPLKMREIAEQLILYEATAQAGSQLAASAAHRVLEAIRQPLYTLVGVQGYQVLMARALTLAKNKAPILSAVSIRPDGSLLGFSDLTAQEASEAGIVLTAQLLQLLATFVGNDLTLHIFMGVWPDLTISTTKGS